MHAATFLAVIALVTAGAGAEEIEVIIEASVNATQGENVTLTCSFKNNVVVETFKWIFGEKELCNCNETKSVKPNHFQCNCNDKTLVLTIQSAQLNNTGTYTCTLYAQSGHGCNTTELHVSEKSMVISRPQEFIQQYPNQACISESKWINLLGSLTVLLVLILYSSR